MAENSRRNKSLKELSDDIQRSRERVAQDLRTLRAELDLPRQIRKSFRRQPVLWIAAATVIGLVVTVKLGRKKQAKVSTKESEKAENALLGAGFILGLVKIAANLFKPFIVSFVSDKMGRHGNGERFAKKW
jgi:hypothetical protein